MLAFEQLGDGADLDSGVVPLPQVGMVEAAGSLFLAHGTGGFLEGNEEAQGRLLPLHHALEVADVAHLGPAALDDNLRLQGN